MSTIKTLPVFKIVAFDVTKEYSLECQQKHGKIFQIYLYNANDLYCMGNTRIKEWYRLRLLDIKCEFMTHPEMEMLLLNNGHLTFVKNDGSFLKYKRRQHVDLRNQITVNLEEVVNLGILKLFEQGLEPNDMVAGEIIDYYNRTSIGEELLPNDMLLSYEKHFYYEDTSWWDQTVDIYNPVTSRISQLAGERKEELLSAIALIDAAWQENDWESSPDPQFSTYREHLDSVISQFV